MSLLLLLATAGTPFADAAPVKAAGKIELTGVVEVPLYAGITGSDRFSYVEVTVGEKKLLLRVATGHREVRLTEKAIGKLGLKSTGPEDGKKAKVGEMALGGAKLTGVTANVMKPLSSEGLALDGELSLAAFDDLAFAVLPSTGVLKLAVGADGAALVSAVGAPAPYAQNFNTTKKKVSEIEVKLNASPVLVAAKWSGVEVQALLATELPNTRLAREVEGVELYSVSDAVNQKVTLPAAPSTQSGESRDEWREVGLAGASVWSAVERPGAGVAHAYAVNAKIGVDVLGGLDLAVDPTTKTYAVKAAPASKRADYRPTYEAALRAALEAKPADDGTPPDDEAKKAARNGGLGGLADYLQVQGRFDEAVAARKELTVAEPDDCTSWTSYGESLVRAGKAAEAVEPLTRATSLYQPWSALPLAEREDIAAAKGKAEKAKKEWTGQIPQDHACHVAPGLLALAQLQARNGAAVATIYPASLDLDGTLPVAAGNAALLQGQFDVAQAAYLQALKLGGTVDDRARVGLYLALAPKDFAAARGQLERLHLQYEHNTDPLLVRLYVEGVRQSEGPKAVLTALDTLLGATPGDAVLLAQRSRERTAAGDAAGAASDWETAKKAFEASVAQNPSDATAWATWSSALAQAGQVAEAQKAADTAVKLAPGNGMAWLAMADTAAAAGDTARAAESRVKAGTMWVDHPAYALLLAR